MGYVCSRDGQGSPSVYQLVPEQYQHYQIAGRLDKDSSGLLIFTPDGNLLNKLTHPSFNKQKVYLVELNKPLDNRDLDQLQNGVDIGDARPSKLIIQPVKNHNSNKTYQITLTEGRNRQIRRSFAALGYSVIKLHCTKIGHYRL